MKLGIWHASDAAGRHLPRLCLMALMVAAGLYAGDSVPDWVRAATQQQVPSYPPKVTHVVLFQEEHVTVEPDGRRVMRERGAIKVVERGRNSLSAARTYDTKAGKIRDFQAWLVPPGGGKPRVFGKNQTLDISLASGEMYDEARTKVIEAGSNLDAGSVFAWDVTEEEKTVFTQYPYAFQDTAPVLVSRFVLSLPPGWEVRGTVFNRPPVEPVVSGSTFTWELRNLPWIEPEEFGPETHALAPRLGITYFAGSDNRAGLPAFKDWKAVSAWQTPVVDAQAAVTSAIRTKAGELTAGAKTELGRIRAIAQFAQQTTYISVQTNVTRGGGYTPHPAEQVLTRNYGDCKDKVTLMRALLKAAGIDSYLIAIYSRDREYVRPEWPSPHQFNHAIIAIRVPADLKQPTVLQHPRLGPLLIFDPTDPTTPVGDLPDEEQGSRALILAGPESDLVTMPILPAAANRIESQWHADMDESGALKAHAVRDYFGQAACQLRYVAKTGGAQELKRVFERSMSFRLGGMSLNDVTPDDHMTDDLLNVKMDFVVGHFGQIMQERMLVVRPGSLIPDTTYALPAKARKYPVRLTAELRQDTVEIRMPRGFKPDEIPSPVHLTSPYGSYEGVWKAAGDQLTLRQTMEIKEIQVPAAEYTAVRNFFEQVSGAQHSPFVLLKE